MYDIRGAFTAFRCGSIGFRGRKWWHNFVTSVSLFPFIFRLAMNSSCGSPEDEIEVISIAAEGCWTLKHKEKMLSIRTYLPIPQLRMLVDSLTSPISLTTVFAWTELIHQEKPLQRLIKQSVFISRCRRLLRFGKILSQSVQNPLGEAGRAKPHHLSDIHLFWGHYSERTGASALNVGFRAELDSRNGLYFCILFEPLPSGERLIMVLGFHWYFSGALREFSRKMGNSEQSTSQEKTNTMSSFTGNVTTHVIIICIYLECKLSMLFYARSYYPMSTNICIAFKSSSSENVYFNGWPLMAAYSPQLPGESNRVMAISWSQNLLLNGS